MITPAEAQEAHETAVALNETEPCVIRTPGLRCVCMYCGCDLKHSDPDGANTSHGVCWPLCQSVPAEWRAVMAQI